MVNCLPESFLHLKSPTCDFHSLPEISFACKLYETLLFHIQSFSVESEVAIENVSALSNSNASSGTSTTLSPV